MNEPRTGPGGAEPDALHAWVDSTAAFVKSEMRPAQPLTVGAEGWFGATTPATARGRNPYAGAEQLGDFARLFRRGQAIEREASRSEGVDRVAAFRSKGRGGGAV
jgi:hypothetical protein